MCDTVTVDGGPAGLSAALMLGRCRRRVIGCVAGSPRKASAEAAVAINQALQEQTSRCRRVMPR